MLIDVFLEQKIFVTNMQWIILQLSWLDFFGSFFIGSTLVALYILFIRPNGVEGAWGFFNLVFVQNLTAFFVGIYSIKINKLGHTEKTSDEGIYAPGVLMILSAVLCYGLADKIYLS